MPNINDDGTAAAFAAGGVKGFDDPTTVMNASQQGGLIQMTGPVHTGYQIGGRRYSIGDDGIVRNTFSGVAGVAPDDVPLALNLGLSKA